MTLALLIMEVGVTVLAAVVGIFLMNEPWTTHDLSNAWTWLKTHIRHHTKEDE